MPCHRIAGLVVALVAAAGLSACSDDEPVAPGTNHNGAGGGHQMTPEVTPLVVDPFTFRATLDPYKIHQLPDFLMHSKETKDIVIQRSIFTPGAGFWHIHPGPSFIIVLEGEIKVERFSPKNGCTESQVYQPNDGYFEIANEVHRAVVMSAQSAVLLVARFNIPVGGAFTIPVAAPDC
jgi:quercetin dioxygenase-like cupin family protein